MIKTWEAFEPQESLLTKSDIISNKKEDPAFNLKTIRLYDKHNDIMTEIMTEQVIGEFNSNIYYEASTLMYNNCIYYFKRHIVDRRLATLDGCMTSTRDNK